MWEGGAWWPGCAVGKKRPFAEVGLRYLSASFMTSSSCNRNSADKAGTLCWSPRVGEQVDERKRLGGCAAARDDGRVHAVGHLSPLVMSSGVLRNLVLLARISLACIVPGVKACN